MTPAPNFEFSTPKGGRLVSSEPFPNGNMISTTAQFEFLTPGGHKRWRMGLEQMMIEPGLFSRYCDRKENTSIDDYLCVGCLPQFAPYILGYGRKTWGFFNVFTPGKKLRGPLKQWLWRFPGFYQHLKLVAGEKINLLDALIWSFAVVIAAHKSVKNQDSWVQSHLMVKAFIRDFRNGKRERSLPIKIMRTAAHYWTTKKPAPTWQIVMNYLNLEKHPLIDLWREHG